MKILKSTLLTIKFSIILLMILLFSKIFSNLTNNHYKKRTNIFFITIIEPKASLAYLNINHSNY